MSEQDVPVLAELDRRARTAAAALRGSIATLVAEDASQAPANDGAPASASPPGATAAPASASPPGATASAGPPDQLGPAEAPSPAEPASRPATKLPGPPELEIIYLDPPAGRVGRRPTRARRGLLVAAVVAVLAAVGGAIAVVTGDDGPSAVSSGGSELLLPGWLPAGLRPVQAVDFAHDTGSDQDAGLGGVDGDIAVYGDPDADDPWSAVLGVLHVADQEAFGGPPTDGESVTVAGHDAVLRQGEGTGWGGTSPSWEVEWEVDGGRLLVAGARTPYEALAAAEAATTEPAIEPSGLPDGYTELARGPISATFSITYSPPFDFGRFAGSGLAVTYADRSEVTAIPVDGGEGPTAVTVVQRPGPASAVDLPRAFVPDSEAITVRGHHAVVSRAGIEGPGGTGTVAVQWAEPDGQLVTVVGSGVTEDVVLRVAESLQTAGADEVAGLVGALADLPPPEFRAVPAGRVVVASGDSPTGRWRILANPRRSANIGALTIEAVWGPLGNIASTTGDRVEPPLDLAASYQDRTVVVWGVLWVDAASVTVEAPDHESVALDIHAVDGWSHPVVADAFPEDHFAGAGEVVVVARDADGREVGRNSTVLRPPG
jgi:hypothetical protein